MKQREFVKMLEKLGVKVTQGTNHYKAFYNGKQTTLPRHPGKEIDNQFAKLIAKQIGIELKL